MCDGYTVIFECRVGPFTPMVDEDLATWAPVEGDGRAGDLVRWMLRAAPADRFERTSDT